MNVETAAPENRGASASILNSEESESKFQHWQLELNFSPPYRKIPQITDGTSLFHLWFLES